MSKQWVCAKCGATAYSKCPDSRNVFEKDIEIAYIRSALATHVIPTSNGSEVFLNLTVYEEENPLLYAIDFLAKHADKLKSITCDHWWFMHSETEEIGICVCDHAHPTTCSESFKEAKLAGTKDNENERVYTHDHMFKGYTHFIQYVLDQFEKKSRIAAYPDGNAQEAVSQKLGYIKSELSKLFKKMYTNDPVKPAVHMQIRGKEWGDPDILDISCNNLEIGKEILALLQDKHFPNLRAYDDADQRIEASLIPSYCKCEFCGEEVTGKSIVADKKIYHQRCHNRLTKVTTRYVRLKFNDMQEAFANKLGNVYHSFGPDYDYEEDSAKQLTENLRNMLGSIAWSVELLRFDYSRPDTYEYEPGKVKRWPGGVFMRFKGLVADIEKVVSEIKRVNK